MSYLIAGSKGYVGKILYNKLIEKEGEVFGLFRDKTENIYSITKNDLVNGELVIWQGDLSRIGAGLRLTNPKFIVNLTASINKILSFESIRDLCRNNIEFNSILANFACELKTERYVFISTYSTSIDGLTYSPQTFYAATKKAAEDTLVFFAQSKSLNVSILHVYDIYGPDQPHRRFLSEMIDALLRNKQFHMSIGNQELNLIHVSDVISAIIRTLDQPIMLTKENPQHYTLSGDEIIKVRFACQS